MSEALEIVERAAFDDGEMRAYDKFWDAIASRKSEINAVKREAEKAKAEAEEAKTKLKQEKLDTARKMKAKGFAIADIAEITDLIAEEIEGLKE